MEKAKYILNVTDRFHLSFSFVDVTVKGNLRRRGGGGRGALTYKMGMYVPRPKLNRRGLTELVKLKKWAILELIEL